MTLRRKLLLIYGFVGALFLLIALLAGIELWTIVRGSDQLMERNLPLLRATSDIRDALGREYAITVGALLVSPEQLQELDDVDRELRDRIKVLELLTTSDVDREILDDFVRSYDQLWQAIVEWKSQATAFPADRRLMAQRFATTRASSASLYETNLAALMLKADQANRRASISLLVLPIMAALTLLIGALASMRFVGRITAPLENLAGAAQRLGEYHFGERVRLETGTDEINALANRFGEMSDSLQRFARLNVNKLIAERRRSDTILESISDGLVVIDEQGRVERVNPVALRQLGLVDGDPVGVPLGELLRKPEIDAQVAHQLTPPGLDRAGSDDVPPSYDLIVERAGEQRILSYSLMPFAEPGGTGRGLIVTLRDVTLEREFESMRRGFMRRASHELRTPVTSIRMGLELLRERLPMPPDSLEKELLDTVMAETRRLVALLTDLLELSRFQAGEQAVEKQACDVGELLTRATERFRALAGESGVTLGRELPATPLAPCELDPLQMDRVLDNLIANALRHTPRGGQILLKAARQGDGFEIGVCDTGEGIPYSQQSRVFKPFVQVGKRGGGAGLGLAIASEIVRQHGGEISLVSVPNRGATFTIHLPA